MIRKIISENEILKAPTLTSKIDAKSLSIALDICQTLQNCWAEGRRCLSVSANQIGENEKIIAIAEKIGGKIHVFYNPSYRPLRGEWEFWEDNLSRPKQMFMVRRAFEIVVEYQFNGKTFKNVHLKGQTAALFQQEVDNLNGILPEERAIALADVEIKSKNIEL